MEHSYDPWTGVTTKNGYAADEVISALQKCIRRGETELAVRFAYEMFITSPELEDMLWRRLNVISVEDIGFGALESPVLIDTLDRIRCKFSPGSIDRPLFFVHAIRYLCSRPKTRSSEVLKNIIDIDFSAGRLPQIPDVALDMHTARGQAMGREEAFFYEEASKVSPPFPEENDYLERLLTLLRDEGRM